MACSKKSDKDTLIGPDLSNDSWGNNYPMALVLTCDQSGTSLSASIWVKASSDTTSYPFLYINDHLCFCTYFSEEGQGHWYQYHIDLAAYSDMDTPINYRVNYGNLEKTGAIIMPPRYLIDYPEYCSFADYQMNWTLENNPDTQWFYYDIIQQDYEHDADAIQLARTARTCKLEKSKLSDIHGFNVSLESVNIAVNTADFLAMGTTSTDHAYTIYMKNKDAKFPDHHLAFINHIMAKMHERFE